MLKALGIASLAVFAVSAVAAVSASAEGHFVSEEAHTIIAGESLEEVVISDPASGLEGGCQETTYQGTLSSSTVTEIELQPKMVKCNLLESEVDVQENGCTYRVALVAEPAKKHSITKIKCPKDKVLHWTITGPFGDCTITVKEQIVKSGAVNETAGSGKTHDVREKFTATGVHVVYDGGFFKCGVPNGYTSETFSITATTTLKGFATAGGQLGITAT